MAPRARPLLALLLLATLAPAALAAQRPAAAGSTLEAAVRDTVAARWGVDAADVRIEWRRAPRAEGTPRPLTAAAGGSWLFELGDARSGERVWLRAGVLRAVPVAARGVERGAVLEAADVAEGRRVEWGPPRPAAQAPVGWVARRRIAAGEPLLEPAVAPAPAVRAGQTVRAVWSAGRIHITLPATAIGTVAVGERLTVRTETGRRLEAVARAGGWVEIDNGGSR